MGRMGSRADTKPFKDRNWVKTNGSYGHGCACMKVTTILGTKKLDRILNAKEQPLSTCRQDPALPRR